MYHRYRANFLSHGIFFLLVSSISKTRIETNAQSSGLFDRWNLPDLPTRIDFVDDDRPGLDFLFEFPISNQVATPANVDVSLYDKGCKYNDGDPPVELRSGTMKNIVFRGDATTVIAGVDITLGNRQIDVASLLDQYPTLWDEQKSRITFCVRFSLMTEDIEVNFVEILVAVDVVLEVGFSIKDVNVSPKEKITSINRVSYQVKAYLCGGNYQPILEEELVIRLHEVCDPITGEYSTVEESEVYVTESKEYQQELSDAQKREKEDVTYPQGSVIRVCIRPDDTALGKVSMRQIESMVFQGTYNDRIAYSLNPSPPTTSMSGGVYNQYAVQDGTTEISSGLSAMSCDKNRMEGRPNEIICAVDTILVAAFYWRSPGTAATVFAFGEASLTFGSGDDTESSRQRTMTRRLETNLQDSIHPEQRNNKATLDMVWNMTRPDIDYSGMGDPGGGFDFDMNYIVSDAMSHDMVKIEVWNKTCEEPGKIPILSYSSSSQSSTDLLYLSPSQIYETGIGAGSQTMTIPVRWKRDSNDFVSKLKESDFYRENSDGSLIQVSMCVRFQLHTKPSKGGVEVNFLETPVVINIDMTAGVEFNVGFDLTSNDDKCLQELETMGGLNDLVENNLIWFPGGTSSDPMMPLGPSLNRARSPYGSYSSPSSSSNSWSSHGYDNAFFKSPMPGTSGIVHSTSSWAAMWCGMAILATILMTI